MTAPSSSLCTAYGNCAGQGRVLFINRGEAETALCEGIPPDAHKITHQMLLSRAATTTSHARGTFKDVAFMCLYLRPINRLVEKKVVPGCDAASLHNTHGNQFVTRRKHTQCLRSLVKGQRCTDARKIETQFSAHLAAAFPTRTAPSDPNETTEGVVRPQAVEMIRGTPSSTTCAPKITFANNRHTIGLCKDLQYAR